MDLLTAFGLFAVACLLGAIYGFLQGAWPFGMIEAVSPLPSSSAPSSAWSNRSAVPF
jgi:hypothetical protein